MTPVIHTKSLCKHYQDADQCLSVLTDLNFSLLPAKTVSIMGASGSGKSTLLQLLAGLDTVSSGEVYWEEHRITDATETTRCLLRSHYVGYLYQFHHLLPEFSILDNIALPLMIQGIDTDTARTKAEYYADYIALKHRQSALPSSLSGGERQRVALARALITEPRCILADEPTGSLDADTALSMCDLLCNARAHYGCAIIVVTHNPLVATRYDEQYQLHKGKLIQES